MIINHTPNAKMLPLRAPYLETLLSAFRRRQEILGGRIRKVRLSVKIIWKELKQDHRHLKM